MSLNGDIHTGQPVDLVVAHCYLGHFKKLRIITHNNIGFS